MSSEEAAISVKALSKVFAIYERPVDRLKQMLLPRWQRLLRRPAKRYHRDFTAIDRVDLTVHRAETVAIIGRNGSGKSTLLQLICGTLTPSHGEVTVTGRVAALLELGSGFNPEFTGRENIVMNAGILGLSDDEISERLPAIVAFADIGDFVDQPVKTYSSGMYVRLAFAVIAHVDADILVIDEALAVGDALFTQKCMRFLRQFQQRGTLLFVSHDTQSVVNLCQRAIWLDQGRIRLDADAKTVCEAYLKATLAASYSDKTQALPAPTADGAASNTQHVEVVAAVASMQSTSEQPADTTWRTGYGHITRVELDAVAAPEQATPHLYQGGETLQLTIEAVAQAAIAAPILGFIVRDRLGQDMFGSNTLPDGHDLEIGAGQTWRAVFRFTLPPLRSGDYSLTCALAAGTQIDHIQHHWCNDVLLFTVLSPLRCFGVVALNDIQTTTELAA